MLAIQRGVRPKSEPRQIMTPPSPLFPPQVHCPSDVGCPMVRDALRPQRHELQAATESAGLRLMHTDKVLSSHVIPRHPKQLGTFGFLIP